MRTARTTATYLALPVLAALLLSGCGSDDEPAAGGGTTSSAEPQGQAGESFNPADVAFASGMVPHHAQAVEMADLALTKADSTQVKGIAEKIKASQGAEIQTLSDLLSSWGEPVPSTEDSGSMEGMDHGSDHSMHPGMMTTEQMDELEGAKGAEFDQLWVDLMVEHHEGAVAMSKTEVADGSSEQAKQLAQTVADAQTKELSELKSLATDLA